MMTTLQTQPLNTLWYTRCPVPTGLGISIQKIGSKKSLMSSKLK